MKKPKKPLFSYGLQERINDLQKEAERKQQAQKSKDLLDIFPVEPDMSAAPTPSKSEPVQVEPVQNLNRLQNLKGSGGRFLRLPHEIVDQIFPTLDPPAAVAYLHLYRLAAGFGQETCTISIPALASRCKVSENTTRRALRQLTALKLIKTVGVKNGEGVRGSQFRICTGSEIEGVQNLKGFKNRTGSEIEPNKEIDDLKERSSSKGKTDDDDSQIQPIRDLYEKLTGNEWKNSDRIAYEKIKDVPLDTIEQGIRITSQRALNRPNSLAYFVKEILNQANPSEQSRAQRKRALEKVIEDVRAIHVGEQGYTFPDFLEDVKRRCIKDNVLFDNDLFNEIVN